MWKRMETTRAGFEVMSAPRLWLLYVLNDGFKNREVRPTTRILSVKRRTYWPLTLPYVVQTQ